LIKVPSWLAAKVVYPLHETFMQRPTFAYLKELNKSQFLSREEIEILQFHKLKNLLTIAQQHCPWHAEHIASAGIDINSDIPLTPADLQLLPTMNKTDAQKAITNKGASIC